METCVVVRSSLASRENGFVNTLFKILGLLEIFSKEN
jgi:hypothetical protein